jgi:hypothetical protein
MAKQSTKPDSFTRLVELALKAGFLTLAYCLLVIAGCTTGLALTAGDKGLPYEVFHWVLAGLSVLACAPIMLELFGRTRMSFGYARVPTQDKIGRGQRTTDEAKKL